MAAQARANLAMQDLSDFRLPGVRLRNATLTGTNLSTSVLTAAEFRGAGLFGAILQKAEFRLGRQKIVFTLPGPTAEVEAHHFVTRYTEGFSHFVTSMTAPVASGRRVGRVGRAATGTLPPYHGAQPIRRLSRFSGSTCGGREPVAAIHCNPRSAKCDVSTRL